MKKLCKIDRNDFEFFFAIDVVFGLLIGLVFNVILFTIGPRFTIFLVPGTMFILGFILGEPTFGRWFIRGLTFMAVIGFTFAVGIGLAFTMGIGFMFELRFIMVIGIGLALTIGAGLAFAIGNRLIQSIKKRITFTNNQPETSE